MLFRPYEKADETVVSLSLEGRIHPATTSRVRPFGLFGFGFQNGLNGGVLAAIAGGVDFGIGMQSERRYLFSLEGRYVVAAVDTFRLGLAIRLG